MFPWLTGRTRSPGGPHTPRALPPIVTATIGTLSGPQTPRGSDPGFDAPLQPAPRLPTRPPPVHGKRESWSPQGGRVWDDSQFSAAVVQGISPGNQRMLKEGFAPTGASSVESLSVDSSPRPSLDSSVQSGSSKLDAHMDAAEATQPPAIIMGKPPRPQTPRGSSPRTSTPPRSDPIPPPIPYAALGSRSPQTSRQLSPLQIIQRQTHPWQAKNQLHQNLQPSPAESPRTPQQEHKTSPPSVSAMVAAAAADAQKREKLEYIVRVEQEARMNLMRELQEVKEAHGKEVEYLKAQFEDVKKALMLQQSDALIKQSEIQAEIGRWVDEFENLRGVVMTNNELHAEIERLENELLIKDDEIRTLKDALPGDLDAESSSQDEMEGLVVSKKTVQRAAKPNASRVENSTPGETGGRHKGRHSEMGGSEGSTPDEDEWLLQKVQGQSQRSAPRATTIPSPRRSANSPHVLAVRPRTPPPLGDDESQVLDNAQILMLAGYQVNAANQVKQSDAAAGRPGSGAGGGRSMSGRSGSTDSFGRRSSSQSMAILQAQSQLLATLRDQLQGVSGVNQVQQETLDALIKVIDPKLKIAGEHREKVPQAVQHQAQLALQKEVEALRKEIEQVQEDVRQSRETERVLNRHLDASKEDLNRAVSTIGVLRHQLELANEEALRIKTVHDALLSQQAATAPAGTERAHKQALGEVRALRRQEPILGRSEETHATIQAVVAISSAMSGHKQVGGQAHRDLRAGSPQHRLTPRCSPRGSPRGPPLESLNEVEEDNEDEVWSDYVPYVPVQNQDDARAGAAGSTRPSQVPALRLAALPSRQIVSQEREPEVDMGGQYKPRFLHNSDTLPPLGSDPLFSRDLRGINAGDGGKRGKKDDVDGFETRESRAQGAVTTNQAKSAQGKTSTSSFSINEALAVLSPRKGTACAESNVSQTTSERARALSERAKNVISDATGESSAQAGKTPNKTPTNDFPHGYIGNPRFLSPRNLRPLTAAGLSSAGGFFDRGGGARDSHSSAALHYAGTRRGVAGGEWSLSTSDMFEGPASVTGSPYASRSSYSRSDLGHSREHAASAHVPNPGYRTARGDYAAPYGSMSASPYGAGMTHHMDGGLRR